MSNTNAPDGLDDGLDIMTTSEFIPGRHPLVVLYSELIAYGYNKLEDRLDYLADNALSVSDVDKIGEFLTAMENGQVTDPSLRVLTPERINQLRQWLEEYMTYLTEYMPNIDKTSSGIKASLLKAIPSAATSKS